MDHRAFSQEKNYQINVVDVSGNKLNDFNILN